MVAKGKTGGSAGVMARKRSSVLKSTNGTHVRAQTKVSTHKPKANRVVKVNVTWADLEAVKSDVVLVGHYMGVVPQRAELVLDMLISRSSESASGKLVLTELSKRGAIRGELGEIMFFPLGDRQLVAVAGMGRPGTFRTGQLRRLARTVAQVVGLLPRHNTLATVVIGSGEGNMPMDESVQVFLEGFIEALSGDGGLRIDQVTFVENKLDRAMDIQQALKKSAHQFTEAGRAGKGLGVQVQDTLV